MKNTAIYLDSHATTRVDQEVLAAMLPYFTEHYGNGNHTEGWKASSAIENARSQVSNLIAAKPSEIIFTSGSTEAINIGLMGLAQAADGNRKHIVTQKTEHSAVLKCIEELERRGFEVTMLDVDEVGRIRLEDLVEVVDEGTLLVAIMLANNEIGTVQPVEQIGEICRAKGAKFFCDFTQGIGWHNIDVNRMKIDMACISSHKIYGPRGVGALYLRKLNPRLKISATQFGGGQERGLRSGTHNLPGIVGFGKASELMQEKGAEVFKNIKALRDRLEVHLKSHIDGVKVNGCPLDRHPGNLNVSIPGISGERLIGSIPEVIFSTTSACGSGSNSPSHVLAAISDGVTDLFGAFRLGVGKYNTEEEIDKVANSMIETINPLLSRKTATAGCKGF